MQAEEREENKVSTLRCVTMVTTDNTWEQLTSSIAYTEHSGKKATNRNSILTRDCMVDHKWDLGCDLPSMGEELIHKIPDLLKNNVTGFQKHG